MILGSNIARNAALRENVFMIAICIELRIPLFLVGKPGSSKSLAKSIVQTSMLGTASNSELLREFKQVRKWNIRKWWSTGCCTDLDVVRRVTIILLSLPLLLPPPPSHTSYVFPITLSLLSSLPFHPPTGTHLLLPVQPTLYPRECDWGLQYSSEVPEERGHKQVCLCCGIGWGRAGRRLTKPAIEGAASTARRWNWGSWQQRRGEEYERKFMVSVERGVYMMCEMWNKNVL